jgi:uncharacterized YigZ family protein
MKFVNQEYSFIFEEKKSKFITYIFPFKDFDKTMNHLKSEHPKGRHFVYAYRHLNDYEQVVENSSDDGEPKGTSGRPSLNVLIGNDLINTAVVIVRYFGGIKLGTGGLVRAYSQSVNTVIQEANLLEYMKLEKLTIICTYNELSKIEYILSKENISSIEKEFSDNVSLNIKATKEVFRNLKNDLPRTVKFI